MNRRAVAAHWADLYATNDSRSVSWYEDDPRRSLEWVRAAAPGTGAAIVDVGAGASLLVDRLVADGYRDVTVIDVAETALDEVRVRLGPRASTVTFVTTDVLRWTPDRDYDVWHDRAVFHFLVDPDDRDRYVTVMRTALRPGGHAVMAAFAPWGPERCSGLPTMRYDAASLAAVLGPGFVVVRAEVADHVTPGGAIQPFTWVTVRREP